MLTLYKLFLYHTHKFIYTKNHKVASTSIENVFQSYCTDKILKMCDNIDITISDKGIIGNRIL